MIPEIKEKLWDYLRTNQVSLAMLYDREGKILWHQGREIKGESIHEASGFSTSYARKSLKEANTIHMNDVVQPNARPRSAKMLALKSLVIVPVSHDHFFYIDSGTKEYFNDSEVEIFKILGSLLGESLNKLQKNGKKKGIAGFSTVIKNLKDVVLKYSLEDHPVLLQGETGVGKSHIAELIHDNSGRSGPFITVNTPAIPEHLFESMVFGHKKGAFTDAKTDKKGFVDEACGGTLFFDEISEVPLSFQSKMLRFIDTHRYVVLGESQEREADVRIIAATNKDLGKAIDEKEFRSDLFYRLQVLEIKIPPLRERKEDIRALIEEHRHLLRGKEIDEGFWQVMLDFPWPGNVRELLTLLTRAGILLGGKITGEDVKRLLDTDLVLTQAKEGSILLAQIKKDIAQGKDFWQTVWPLFMDRHLSRTDLKNFLTELYHQCGGSLKNLAEYLHITEDKYKLFVNSLHRHGVHPGKGQPQCP